MDLNFDLLAQETLDLGQQLGFNFDRTFDGHKNLESIESLEEAEPQNIELEDEHAFSDEGAGLVFKLEKGIQTFCIRASLIEDLNSLPELIETNDKNLFHELRIESLSEFKDVYTFEVHDLDLGKSLIKQLCNRRFPYHEENVFNLSDPGYSWWLDRSTNKLKIFFQSQRIDRASCFQNLGPMGDPHEAGKSLFELINVLNKNMVVNEFLADTKSFVLSCANEKGNLLFHELVDLFTNGDEIQSRHLFTDKPHLLHFLDEIALKRQFWLSIDELL